MHARAHAHGTRARVRSGKKIPEKISPLPKELGKPRLRSDFIRDKIGIRTSGASSSSEHGPGNDQPATGGLNGTGNDTTAHDGNGTSNDRDGPIAPETNQSSQSPTAATAASGHNDATQDTK
eukprot:3493026-Alexandrium_andersonii.AAC.1